MNTIPFSTLALNFFLATLDAEIDDSNPHKPGDEMLRVANRGLAFCVPAGREIRVQSIYGLYAVSKARDDSGAEYVVTRKITNAATSYLPVPPISA